MPDKIGRWYVVQTSEYFDGNAFVVEEHVESRTAEQRAVWYFGWDNHGELQAILITGLTAISRGEMLMYPRLRRALQAWDEGDDSEFEQELTALAAVAAAEGAVSDG
jgi:hypothetical protein